VDGSGRDTRVESGAIAIVFVVGSLAAGVCVGRAAVSTAACVEEYAVSAEGVADERDVTVGWVGRHREMGGPSP
jgi:hypothetical protein